MPAEPRVIVRELETSISQLADAFPGRLGLVVRFLGIELEIRLNAEERFTAASIIKVPIMTEVYRQAAAGALGLDEIILLDVADMTEGAGVLQYFHAGLQLHIADAVELMISISDNTATNMVLRRIGTQAVNDSMQLLGLTNTVAAGLFGRARPAELRHRRSETTPLDMADLFSSMARLECVSTNAAASMVCHLEHVTHQDTLPRYLPLTAQPERLGYPGLAVQIAHKSGSLTGLRHDVGIITIEYGIESHQAVISAFTDRVDDHDLWTPENAGERFLADIGRLVFEAMVRMV